MFVETMTFKEIRREFEKDKKPLVAKVNAHKQKIMKLMRHTKISTYDKFYDYTSPLKNKWVYRIIGKSHRFQDFRIEIYCLFFTERSYAVISYAGSTNQIIYLTSHFFTRFNQREKLEQENLHEIIKTYFRENPGMANKPMQEVQPGIWQMFSQTSRGVSLGYYYTEPNILEFRTFITNDMLKGDQIELSKQLEEKFKIHIVRKGPKAS